MKTATLKLYSLSYNDVRTYLLSALFVIGNILLPQLCHLIPNGGMMLLPIYFFTLIGAYKYGWQVGIVTAVMSPLINSMLFGMPAVAMLPVILVKSSILAIAAALVANKMKKISIISMILVVAAYQFIGTLAEWAIVGDFYTAIQDIRIGIPGIVIQIVGGYLVIRYLLKK